MRKLRLMRMNGLTSYEDAHRLQLETVELLKANQIPDTLILLEHPPVITLGKSADAKDVVAEKALLASQGIEVIRTERGGQVTYHGPGQVVGYPIINLDALNIGVSDYVKNLEEIMIRAAKCLDVDAGRRSGMTGVFSDQGKIGAIGVRVTRGITYHGFAFNVHPELSHYQFIVPCGMTDIPVTSLAAILGKAPEIEIAMAAIVNAFFEVFGFMEA